MAFLNSSIAIIYLFLSNWFSLNQSEWYKYEDSDCEISFPKMPKRDTLRRETQNGKFTIYLHVLKNDSTTVDSNSVYQFIKIDYISPEQITPSKEDVETLSESATNGLLAQINGKVLSKEDIKLDSFPGKEIKLVSSNNTKLILLRCYIAASKIYALEITSPIEKQKNLNAITFLKSFKIK